MIKTLTKVGIEGACLNIIKAIYDKPTANIVLNGEKLKAFPQIRKKTRMTTFITSIKRILGVPATVTRQEKEI